ncbi:hypothetical protein [Halococcus sp. AFM35]|uniref:hypothetical protein n=1 Tax=Halococcus sp. AFM35 TaxID=3421653 RepID=UPI003EB74031
MTKYDIHRPSFSATTTDDWEFPTEQDFPTDDLSAVADHFLLSASGFDDPDQFEDLQLPVVNSQGYLSNNGLWAARSGPYSVERIADIDPETKAEVLDLIDDLGTENFDTFEDVVVTEPEWGATTGSQPADSAGGVVDSAIDAAEASHSPGGAVVGLGFLLVAAAVVNDRRG